MPRMTAYNLHKGDDLQAIENALKVALTSLPWMEIDPAEVDLVPAFAPEGFHATVARVDVELWRNPARTKEGFQKLALLMAHAFRDVTSAERKIKVVIKPYDIEGAGWVFLS